MTLDQELHLDAQYNCGSCIGTPHLESTYSVVRAISGMHLHDSFHLGSVIVNDYGRPYENGFSNYSGACGYATAGRFTAYVRGEFEGSPAAGWYLPALVQTLVGLDETLNPVMGPA